jgi:D-3-phosphoglycerate dehydrogenase
MSLTSFPKNKINILLLENISLKALELFQEEGFNVECLPKISSDELEEKIKTVHAIGVRSKTRLTKQLLQKANKLLCIGCYCIGTDQTDLKEACNLGIPVFNSPYANTRSVAELVIGEMIALSRKFTDRSLECHNGFWNKSSVNCVELRCKKLGIVGYGHVGSQVSVLAEALGMQVFYYDIVPVLTLGNAKKVNSLDDLLTKCDFISLHVPKTPETVNMIDQKQVEIMKTGSYLINASRGDVVNVKVVADALKNGHLSGAAFDVFPNEPSNGEKFISELQSCPNTILTPHIGGSTVEAQDAIGIDVASKMIAFINRGSSIGSTNFPEIDLKVNSKVHRLLVIHKNVPGVLSKINNLLSEYNVSAQVLGTMEQIGYLIIEIDREVSMEIKQKMKELQDGIKVRILF